ncbi:MAG: hypothetical protein ABII00_00910 [Elusimicrobiota bacterium]
MPKKKAKGDKSGIPANIFQPRDGFEQTMRQRLATEPPKKAQKRKKVKKR